ncbi:MAG: septum site-determining protein MinD [Clostridia bacterium]|nr:septum site-determining protein MinD [Clostridia bacterium]
MARKIVVTSGKGGVGKTTVAASLSAYLARKGQRVVLCDADLGLNNIDVATGVESLITYDIVDVIEGRCRAVQALVQHPDFPNLYVLTSSHSAPERYVSPQAFKLVLDTLAPKFDFIFIDCPAGIEDGFHRAVASANEAMVITTPQVSAIRDADKVITLLKSYDFSAISLLVNRVRGDLLFSGDCLMPQEIEKLLKTPLIGVIPEEYSVATGALSDIHTAVKTVGNNLLTGKKKLYDTTRKYAGFFGGLRRMLKRNL